MTAPAPPRPILWTVATHDTYAVLHRPDGTAAARFHVIAEAHEAAARMNAMAPSPPQLRCLRQTPTGAQQAIARQSTLYQHGDMVLIWVNEGDLMNVLMRAPMETNP